MQEKSNKWIYVVVIVVVAALMVAGVAMYRHGKDTREARAKAQELIEKLEAAGLKAPSEDTLVTLFGVDGGAAAQDPDQALTQSQYAWQLGTSGPASRPVILDPDFVKAEEIFLSVYAPDKLPGFREFVNDLELEETTD